MELTEDERTRLDIEFQVTSALRDGIWQASGDKEKSTYKQAFSLGSQVAPELYHSVNRLIGYPKQTALAQEIRQSARAQTALESRVITPFDYANAEIAKLRDQLDALDADEAQHLLISKLHRYENVLQELKPREHREAVLIFGDAVVTGIGLPYSDKGYNLGYKDYILNPQRLLRVRVTHLEAIEDKVGCDLIYENLDCVKRTARIVMIQYKTWEGQNPAIHYNPRDDKQVKRMTGATCNSRLCDPEKVDYRTYRLPTCTSFLRPTDRLQQPDSLTTSTSLHIPICLLEKCWQPNRNGGKSIRREQINNRSLSNRTFLELFDNSMVGSVEVSWDRLESLYQGYGIFDSSERVIIHMQDAKNSEMPFEAQILAHAAQHEAQTKQESERDH